MAVQSNIVASFGFHPSFCHFDAYTRTATYDFEKGTYKSVASAEARQWRPGRAAERRRQGTEDDQLGKVDLTEVRPDLPVPDESQGTVERPGVIPNHWIYVFSATRGSKQAQWWAELFAIEELDIVLNPNTTRDTRLGWSPKKGQGENGEESAAPASNQPPPTIAASLNGRDKFVTALAVPYRLSDECIALLEAEIIGLADFVEVAKGLRSFTAEDGSVSPTDQWMKVPVLYPLTVAKNLAAGIREARSKHSRRNGAPGENPANPSGTALPPNQAETESCKQHALVSAVVALMKSSGQLKKDLSDRLSSGEPLLVAKRSLKTRPYEQLRFHVEAELLGADLAGWLSRRLVRIVTDGYLVPTNKPPEIEELVLSLALAAVALKYTSTGLALLGALRSGDWRGTLLGSIAAPSEPGAITRIEHARPWADAVLAIGAVALSARILLEAAHSIDVAVELEAVFGAAFEGKWTKSFELRKKSIDSFVAWDGWGFGNPDGPTDKIRMRACRLEVRMEMSSRFESIAGGMEKALKILDALNLVMAVRELHEISESNPELRSQKIRDVIFQSLDLVKSIMEFAFDGKKGFSRVATRALGTILAARTIWQSGFKAYQALSYGDLNAYAAMATVTATSIMSVGIAYIGGAGAAAGHFGAIVAAIGVLASLVYTWATDTKLQTFVLHSSIGRFAFREMSVGEPGWATISLNKLASGWNHQLEALAALQGQFSLYTDHTMTHHDTELRNVRLRPGVLGSASRFIATWFWKDAGDPSHAPLRSFEVRVNAGEGMHRDAEGLYIDLTVPLDAFNKATDAGKPIPLELKVSVIREVYAADGVKVTLPLHAPAVMDCIRTKKSSTEKIESMEIKEA